MKHIKIVTVVFTSLSYYLCPSVLGVGNEMTNITDDQCIRVPPDMKSLGECSMMPRMFSMRILYECGFHRPSVARRLLLFKRNPKSFLCKRYTCLLRKTFIMVNETTIHKSTFFAYLDMWAKSYPIYRTAIESIGQDCLLNNVTSNDVGGDCAAMKLFRCIIPKLSMAKSWGTDSGCEKLKQFIQNCSPMKFDFTQKQNGI